MSEAIDFLGFLARVAAFYVLGWCIGAGVATWENWRDEKRVAALLNENPTPAALAKQEPQP